MGRVARKLVLVLVVLSVLGVPALALGADPKAGGHPRTHPTRSARVGPVQTITSRVGINAVPSGEVDVVSSVWWTDTSDYLNVAGEVVNGTTGRREFVLVAVTIKDAADNVVGTTSTYIDIDQLAPGMTSSFWTAVAAPPGADSVWVAVDPGDVVTAMPQGALQATLGVPYTDTYGWRHHPGTLKNLASFPVKYGQVVLTFYEADGSVLDTDWTYSELDTIPAGGTSPFDVVLFGGDPGAVRIGVAAQARSDADFSTYVTSWNNYFNDIGASAFRSDIIWNAEAGITTGCGAGLFCPTASVPRDQMASFLARALGLSGAAPNAFTDDAGNPHEPNINLVAREKIATGCGAGKFCPSAKVARDQMASFLARARSLSGAAPNAFTDDNGNLHETNINLVARAGIATGCGGGKYCPSALVTREQMAAFLRRAFGSG